MYVLSTTYCTAVLRAYLGGNHRDNTSANLPIKVKPAFRASGPQVNKGHVALPLPVATHTPEYYYTSTPVTTDQTYERRLQLLFRRQ